MLSRDNTGNTIIAAFKAAIATQGVGIAFNSIRSTGSNANVDLALTPKGSGSVIIQGPLKTTCRNAFTAIDGGRICMSISMQGPALMHDSATSAIRACRQQSAHVCTHADMQQICGAFLFGDSGLNPSAGIGANHFW